MSNTVALAASEVHSSFPEQQVIPNLADDTSKDNTSKVQTILERLGVKYLGVYNTRTSEYVSTVETNTHN